MGQVGWIEGSITAILLAYTDLAYLNDHLQSCNFKWSVRE